LTHCDVSRHSTGARLRSITGYIVDLVTATRESSGLAVGATRAASLALLKLSRAKLRVS